MSPTKQYPSIPPDAFELPEGWETLVSPALLKELFLGQVAASQSRGITILSRREADQLAANSLVAAYSFARLVQAVHKP